MLRCHQPKNVSQIDLILQHWMVQLFKQVPVAQKVPADWIKVNSTKKLNRFHPPNVLEALDSLALAKEELSAACGRAWDTFLADFASHYTDFRASVQALAALDSLHSLAIVSRSQVHFKSKINLKM